MRGLIDAGLAWLVRLMFATLIAAYTGHPAEARQTSISSEAFQEAARAAFDIEGVDGTFVMYDENADTLLRFNAGVARTSLVPASTFKILNSLIFLEEGTVGDADEMISWDGVEREYAVWNRDQDLRSAYRYSAVWAYQQLARKLGRPRLQAYLDVVGYGNGRIGQQVDEFWLDGSLQITPEEQVHFLRRLHSGNLPFSQRTIDLVKDIMIVRQSEGFVLRGKTGLALRSGPSTGWFVGYLETQGNTYIFALAVELGAEGEGRDRVGLTTQILMRLGVLRESSESSSLVTMRRPSPDAPRSSTLWALIFSSVE